MLRTAYRKCPACADRLEEAGSVEQCRGCAGAWVKERIVEEMIKEMHDEPSIERLSFDEIEAAEATRSCPICQAEMAHVGLEEVVLDRCPGHGLWFDPTELQRVLHAAGENQPGRREPVQAFFRLLKKIVERKPLTE